MQEEIKETIYIGVSCMLLAIVFIFIINAIQLRNEYANVRNEASNQKEYSKVYDEYETYNGYEEYASNTWTREGCIHCISGTDVVSAIKKYMCNSGIAIFVNDNELGSQDLFINNAKNSLEYTAEYLQTLINSSSKYHAILYYGDKKANSMKYATYSAYDRNKQVTGIIFLRVN